MSHGRTQVDNRDSIFPKRVNRLGPHHSGRDSGHVLPPRQRPIDHNKNVSLIDALILKTSTARSRLASALESCDETALGVGQQHRQQHHSYADLMERLELTELGLELYYLLIAFGCHGAVDVATYLTTMSRGVHRVED
jgi:hypothetical protein